MIVRSVAAVALVAEAAIHGYLAPDHLREMPYIGVGFVLGAVLSLGVLGGLLLARDQVWPWLVGVVLCLGMALLFVASRTTGLPGFKESWTSDNSLGLWSSAMEVLFVACAARVLPGRRGVVAL